MTKLPAYVSTKVVAEIIGVDESQVRRLVKSGALKVDKQWDGQRGHRVSRKSAEQYAANRPKPGPQKKNGK